MHKGYFLSEVSGLFVHKLSSNAVGIKKVGGKRF
jgi:hypothetical protein